MSILISPVVYNEAGKIEKVVERLKEVIHRHPNYSALVVNDGSTDQTESLLEASGIPFITKSRQGVGSAIRTAIRYALSAKFDVIVIMAGNDKDRPHEIPSLIEKISEDYDLVIGSRYLPSGYQENTPLYRIIATKFIHPWLVWLFTGKKLTDTVNGFRAMRVTMFTDSSIHLEQKWLNGYECETYILYKVLLLGYRVAEVPVSKIYPSHTLGYTKIKPLIGWWRIIRPLFLLRFCIKK